MVTRFRKPRFWLPCGFAFLLPFGCAVDIPDIECIVDSDCPATNSRCFNNRCTPSGSDIGETDGVDGVEDAHSGDTANDADDAVQSPCPAGPGVASTAAPGDPCGTCNNGVVVCDRASDVLVCAGARTNSCGGCGIDDQRTGTPCNHCGSVWECDERTGGTICPDPSPNACGGCSALQPSDAVPGRRCVLEDEQPGYWTCTDANSIRCVAPEQNVCGGDDVLSDVPGQPCGVCNSGRWVCATDNSLRCCYGPDLVQCEDRDGEAALNDCGTCSAINSDLAGTACGRCGNGTWALDCSDGQMECTGDTGNSCGGCANLVGLPGEACENGTLQCSGPDSLSCVPGGGRNACGGTAVLDALPGQPCGSCSAGTVVCATPDSTRCAGDLLASDCGRCAPERLQLDAPCTGGRVWACGDSSDRAPVCEAPDGFNVCGGGVETEDAQFSPCGGCGGRFACDGDALTCLVSPENAPALRYVDFDGDGWGDADDTGSSQCGNAEGYAAQTGDCDDRNELVNPGQTEQPGNALDDDCNENTAD